MKILARLFATASLIGILFAPALLAQVDERAPGWIKPGMRLTFYGASGGGGQTYTQVDVAYLDEKVVGLCVRSYLVDASDGAIHALPESSGLVAAAHRAGDWWIHPAELAQFTEGQDHGTQILRGPLTVNGRTYQAIVIHVENREGYTEHWYDTASGILLRFGSASTGAPKTEGSLIGTRQLNLPWNGLPAPAWVAQTHTLEYDGTYGLELATGPVPGLPYHVVVNVLRTGPGWAECTQQATLPSATPATSIVVGTSQTAGLWIPPEALGRLQPGQVLDSDPVTKIRFVVGGMQDGRISLREIGAAIEADYFYALDTGMMVGTTAIARTGIAATRISLALQSRR